MKKSKILTGKEREDFLEELRSKGLSSPEHVHLLTMILEIGGQSPDTERRQWGLVAKWIELAEAEGVLKDDPIFIRIKKAVSKHLRRTTRDSSGNLKTFQKTGDKLCQRKIKDVL